MKISIGCLFQSEIGSNRFKSIFLWQGGRNGQNILQSPLHGLFITLKNCSDHGNINLDCELTSVSLKILGGEKDKVKVKMSEYPRV